MDAPHAIARAVRANWGRTRKELENFSTPDGGNVHDLRVGLRRLLAGLELAEALGARAPNRVRRRLKGLFGSLSPLRDLEVQSKSLRQLGAESQAVVALADELDAHANDLRSRQQRRLARFAVASTEEALVRVAEKLEAQSDAGRALKQVALAAIARRYAKLDRRRQAAADAQSLHRARVALKRYRYVVEIAAPELPRTAARTLARLKACQDELGAIQDASVLIETIERADAAAIQPSPERRATIAKLKDDRARRVDLALAALRAQASAKPPAFSEIFR